MRSTERTPPTSRLVGWGIPVAVAAIVALAAVLLLQPEAASDDTEGAAASATTESLGPVTIAFDGPLYETLSQLHKAADAVVVGQVGRVLGKTIEYGTDVEEEKHEGSGIPLEVVELDVTEVVAGRLEPGPISIIQYDTVEVYAVHASSLREGERVLLFLNLRGSELSPAIEGVDDHWMPVGWDNGVFDVEAGEAKPRMPEAFLGYDASAEELDSLVFSLTEVGSPDSKG